MAEVCPKGRGVSEEILDLSRTASMALELSWANQDSTTTLLEDLGLVKGEVDKMIAHLAGKYIMNL